MSTAKTIQIEQHGGPEELKIVDVPVGEPGPGEIRIRHKAVRPELHRRLPAHRPVPARRCRCTLGMEGAGVVEAVGEGVTHLKAGDRAAYASQPPGSLLRGARDAGQDASASCPTRIDFETGAAMMLKGLTAQYLLKRTLPQGGLQAGDFVLFHAAAGGVGPDRLPVGQGAGPAADRHRGQRRQVRSWRWNTARRTSSTTRTEDFVARVKEITGGKGVKVVYDSVGKDTFDKSLDCLRPFGLMASFGNASGPGAAVRARHPGRQGLALRHAPDAVHAHRHARGHAGRWPTTCSTWSPAAR